MGRLMIVFESVIARLTEDAGTDLLPVNHAAIMIREVGAGHHMVDEEELIFPKIREAGTMDRLLDTLETQHDRAREMIDGIIDLTRTGSIRDLADINEMANLCMSFVIMYRPHSAWEETVLFPKLYDVATENYIDNLHTRMQSEEHELMSNAGFRRLMANLVKIEEAAGTGDLARFTPP